MRPEALLPVLLLAAGCSGGEAERWSWERIPHERSPDLRSTDDARNRREALAARTELGLDDAWRLALHRSESVALDGEELVRLRARAEQVIADMLPRITLKGSWSRQDDPGNLGGSDAAQSVRLRERTEAKVYGRQPLFSGLKEFYALRQSGALQAAQEDAIRQAVLLLYADVAESFYTVLAAERELATRQDALGLARERLEELVQRNRLGISRRAEVLQQEAETASITASIDRLKGALSTAWEVFRFLTGLSGTRTLRDGAEAGDALEPPGGFVSRALARRPDLRALRSQIDAAEAGVGIARSGYLPTAQLEGNYYTHREGVSEDIEWDLLLSVEIPVFEGGGTQARLREARSYVRSARLDLDRRRREIELAVNRAWAEVDALRAELGSLEKAVASAQENYDIVQAEYRLNIVTNIEVLTSFNTLQLARLARDRARYQAKFARVRLEVESGAVPGEPIR